MDLVEQLRIDPENGARRLEVEYKAGLLALARRLCADEGDAEELVNCTFAEVVRSIDRYAEQSAFFGWMARIMIHLNGRKKDRKSNETVVVSEEMPDVAADPDADARLLREVDASLLRDVIEGLPADIRKTLLLHYFMDMPVKDVARFLALPVGTVTWRLHYARQMLAAKLGTQKPGVKLLVFALLLSAGLAIGGALYTLGTAVFGSRAESAEVVSHAENAESAESVSHAENAESAEPTSSTFSTPLPSSTLSTLSTSSTPSTSSTVSTPEPSEMNAKPLLAAASSLALAATSASAATDHWTYTPPATGTRGTISWTDSSGFENVINGIILSDGAIDVYPNCNRGSATLRNADFSIPVRDGAGNELAYSPDFLAGKRDTGSAILGYITGLTNVVVNANATSLGNYCFKSCTALVRVRLPDGIESIGVEAFNGDSALVEIENFLPDSVKTIKNKAFQNCTALTGFLTARGLQTTGDRIFHTCSALQGVDLSESSLSALDIFSFYSCSSLVSVSLPESLTSIGGGCFKSCTSLKTVTPLLPPRLATLGTDSDVAFYDDPIEGHVVCPPTLARVGLRAFRNSRFETFAASKKGLTSIGQYAFWGNVNLTNIVLSVETDSIALEWLSSSGTAGVPQHVWFRNLPSSLAAKLWTGTIKQNITIHLPWSQQEAWREWVASGPSGHTFTFDGATKTLPENLNDVGTWQSGVVQNVTWWKDLDMPTLVLIK